MRETVSDARAAGAARRRARSSGFVRNTFIGAGFRAFWGDSLDLQGTVMQSIDQVPAWAALPADRRDDNGLAIASHDCRCCPPGPAAQFQADSRLPPQQMVLRPVLRPDPRTADSWIARGPSTATARSSTGVPDGVVAELTWMANGAVRKRIGHPIVRIVMLIGVVGPATYFVIPSTGAVQVIKDSADSHH